MLHLDALTFQLRLNSLTDELGLAYRFDSEYLRLGCQLSLGREGLDDFFFLSFWTKRDLEASTVIRLSTCCKAFLISAERFRIRSRIPRLNCWRQIELIPGNEDRFSRSCEACNAIFPGLRRRGRNPRWGVGLFLHPKILSLYPRELAQLFIYP